MRLSLSPSGPPPVVLLLSWAPPAGHWQSYRVLLLDGSQPVVNTSVNWEAVNYTFAGLGLTPGSLYRAVLVVESGGLTAESSCVGATGKVAAGIPGGGLVTKDLWSVYRPKAPTHVSVRLCLVPASVLNLHIRHSDETSLSAMWSHAPSGSRDGYFLTLRHGNAEQPTWVCPCFWARMFKLSGCRR